MPQIVAAVLIGAGIAAGVKWAANEMARKVKSTRAAPQDLKQHAAGAVGPRDLGPLVLDAKTGVYRPANKRAG